MQKLVTAVCTLENTKLGAQRLKIVLAFILLKINPPEIFSPVFWCFRKKNYPSKAK